MTPQNIAHLLIEYRYWILVPLAVIEGPIISFISGTLASLGYFNIYALAVFFFARDMIVDGFLYGLGYFGTRTSFVQRILRKMKVEEGELDELRQLWEQHPARTMFLGKFSYGIAQSFIVVAGAVKMDLRKFFGYGALAAVAQYVSLLFLGYFFGSALGGNASAIINNIQYIIAGAVLIISGYYVFRWYMRRKFSSGRNPP